MNQPCARGSVRRCSRFAPGQGAAPRRLLQFRPVLAPAAAGLAASTVILLAGGQVGLVRGALPPSRWGGLLAGHSVDPTRTPLPGLLLLAGVLGLVGSWFWAWRRLGEAGATAAVWLLAGLWAVPLALGPPLMSNDVFSYLAHGAMTVHGIDPYRHGPGALPASALRAAVDPVWRHARSPYGPLAEAINYLVARLTDGSVEGIFLFRGLAVLGLAVTGSCAQRLAPPRRRVDALMLTILNPVALLQVVSAAHFEGLLGGLLLGAVLAARTGFPGRAVALGSAAGAVKLPALLMVPAVLLIVHAASPSRRTVLRLSVLAVAVAGLCTALVPDGWGWLRGLSTPGHGHTPAAPTSVLAAALTPLTVWTGLASPAVLLTLCRLAGLAVAATVCCFLLATGGRRQLAATVGTGLITVALLGPVYYPWYLLWGLVCLAPVATGRGRRLLIAGSAVSAVLVIPGLTVAEIAAVAVAVTVGTLGWLVWLVWDGTRPFPARAAGPVAPPAVTTAAESVSVLGG